MSSNRTGQLPPPKESRPNIVFILADNVGFGVLSSYNGGILDTATPRLDELASEGLRLTNFNVENQCTPSRAALMTGRLPIRSGIGKAIAAGAPGGLHPWEITIAEMVSDAGYRTAIFGKWHLGAAQGRLPTDQGFDEWFGFESTDIIYWTANPGMPLKDVDYIRESRRDEEPRNVRLYDEDTRREIDRMLTDHAVDYIAKNGSGDQPFFLYVPFAFAHHPVLAHSDFKGRSPAGEFGDSLLEHDYNVGRILDALKAAGIANSTLVVWASDNGPSPLPTVTPWWTIGDEGPWRGEIGTVLEGNIRTSCILRWPGRIPAGRSSNQIVGIVDFFPTLARVASGKVPIDRPMDGVDQLEFFMGRQQKSNREHVLLFLGQKLMAIKWRNFKIHLDGLDRVDGVIENWSFPRAFNLASDPKERWNIMWQNSWLGEEIGPIIAAYAASVKKYPNLEAGQPNDQPPCYSEESSAAETGVEGVNHKLASVQQ
ncbi:MAG TPA: sulfatase-like hydrolase/transferase [Edaphobacter sp.]|jgi:arylsulfatase A-like enzyme|nr:sulfatase-like hydrolase/transferase [Edaphobacter sp.]